MLDKGLEKGPFSGASGYWSTYREVDNLHCRERGGKLPPDSPVWKSVSRPGSEPALITGDFNDK